MIMVSSCLAGLECRYNGSHCLMETIRDLVKQNKAIMVCPEVLGGLPTPREPAEIIGGTGEDVLLGKAKVISKSQNDVTELFIQGAYKTLEYAKQVQATCIVLKESSPSCGSRLIYDGNFSNNKVNGEGVTAALLRKEGFKVISEHELADIV